MTEQTNAKLISKARELLPVETIYYSPEHDYIAHLADALERSKALLNHAARFWRLVEFSSECWRWTGHRSSGGYGQFHLERVIVPAHRVSYEMEKGPVPDGLQLDHLCRVRECVRPLHLEPVTPGENIRRAYAAATHCRNGHPKTPETTVFKSDGSPRCAICKRGQEIRRRARESNRRSGHVMS